MPATQPSAWASRLSSPPRNARSACVSSGEKRRSSVPSAKTAPSATRRVIDSAAGASRAVMTIWPASGRSRISASTAPTTSSASSTTWKSSRTTMKPAGAWARSASSSRASPTPSAPSSRPLRNSGSEPGSSKPTSSASARSGEQAPRVAVGGLQRQPGNGCAAISGVGCGQGAFAKPGRRDEQNQRTCRDACAAPRASARAAARAAPGPGHPDVRQSTLQNSTAVRLAA